MSEVMTPMSFEQLVDWVLQEKKKKRTCIWAAACLPCRWSTQPDHVWTRSGDSHRTGSRSSYPDDTEYRGRLLCGQPFL